MDHVQLRACRPQDLEQVQRIEAASFGDGAYSMAEFSFFLTMSRDGFVLACAGDLVVGYVIAVRRREEGLIQSIAVAPEFRRRGIGEMLLRSALLQMSTKVKRVYLQADVGQDAAIRLYRKLSFVETGKVMRGYYPNGHDAMEMVREITGEGDAQES